MSEDDLASLLDQAEGADDLAQIGLIDRLRKHDGLEAPTSGDAFRAARLLALSGEPTDLRAVARLGKLALDDEVQEAGLLFAEATDKLALYAGRPQPYGTVMVEHQGEIVQPPVDPLIDDAARAEVGVPPLAELQHRMEQVGRELAAERAQQPGMIPPGQRFCRVWSDPDPIELSTLR